MRKIYLLGMLASAGAAQATSQPVQYASVTAITSATTEAYFWIDNQGRKSGNSKKALAEQLGCKIATTDLDIADAELFNCVGKNGWELVTMSEKANTSIKTQTFYFKRQSQ